MSSRRFAKIVACVTITGAVLFATASPASAESGTLRVAAGNGYGPGAAMADWMFWWNGQRSFTAISDVRDICPQDGYGAYLDVIVEFTDNTRTTLRANQDTNGCGPEYSTRSETPSYGKNIKQVRFDLYKRDANTGTTSNHARTGWIDQPST